MSCAKVMRPKLHMLTMKVSAWWSVRSSMQKRRRRGKDIFPHMSMHVRHKIKHTHVTNI